MRGSYQGERGNLIMEGWEDFYRGRMREKLIRVDRENPIIRGVGEYPYQGERIENILIMRKIENILIGIMGRWRENTGTPLAKKVKKVKIANRNKSIIISTKYI